MQQVKSKRFVKNCANGIPKHEPSLSHYASSPLRCFAAQSRLTSAEHFLSGIDLTLQQIAQFPQISRKRDELYPGSRSLPYEQYLIFYRLLNDDIEVLRVVSGIKI